MLKNKFLLLVSLLVALSGDAFGQQKSDWQIWIIPNSYILDEGDTLHIAFGITGYGPLDPTNLKVIAYTEENTLIKYGDEPAQFDTYLITPTEQAPKDRFTKKVAGYSNSILLQSDSDSQFGHLFLTPKTSGEKKLTLIATYSPDGVSWDTTSREFNYHVNSFTEKHQTCLTWLAIIGIFAAVCSIPTFSEILKNKLCKTDHKKPQSKH